MMGSRANGPAAAAGSAPPEHGTAAGAPRPSVAVIGAGVSGLTAAYLLSRAHDVILFEAEGRLGGHAHTHDVTDSGGRRHAVDSGFIVCNDVTYPWLRRLFGELDVQVRPAEMSMSVRCQGCGLEYAGGRGLRGVFAQPRRLIDPRFLRMLWQVGRFRLDPESIVATMDYEHPVYTPEAVRAQSRLSSLATGRTVYAGAYHGWGFHEDGCRSGVEAARHFGVTW
jgi:predicted NAD/FAD-binding protein